MGRQSPEPPKPLALVVGFLWLLGIVMGVLFGSAGLAGAAGPSRAEVHIVGSYSVAQRFREVIEPLLVQQGVRPTFAVASEISVKEVLRPPGNVDGLVARIFIDLREAHTITLYISNSRAESFAFRELRVEPGKDELAREATGAVVDAAVRVLLSGGSLELTRERAEQRLEVGQGSRREARAGPVIAPRYDSSERHATPEKTLRPSAFYGASLLGADGISLSHGPGLGLEVLPDARVHPLFSVQYQLPITFHGSTVGARIWALATRAGASVTLAQATDAQLSLSLVLGLDTIWLSPRASDQALATADDARLIAAGMLRPSLDWRHQLAGFWLGVSGLLDVDLLGTHYTVRRGGAQILVFEPWRARPGLAAFVTW